MHNNGNLGLTYMDTQQSPFHIGIDARFPGGVLGGVEQTVKGLAHGFSCLATPGEQIHFLCHRNASDWLTPALQAPHCTPLYMPGDLPAYRKSSATRWCQWALHRIWPWIPTWGRLGRVRIASSDGTAETAGLHLLHFTHSDSFLTRLPFLYQIHDLQHRHLPAFFSKREQYVRDARYQRFCTDARQVTVMTRWGRRDLIAQYGITEAKIAVIPWAPLLPFLPPPAPGLLRELDQRWNLPERFLFYPAQTWPHKNHLALLEALAWLRDVHRLRIPLVCSGLQNRHYPVIRRRVEALGLGDLVCFTGFISDAELRGLYARADILVFPSQFEGFGMPVLEAFSAGLPVVCSTAACLPDLCGDAARLFDPDAPEAIAAALAELWNQPERRCELRERGLRRAAAFTWEQTCRHFRALYRQVLNRPLTDEDQHLLAATPLV
jgi:glycosyltransferase involved in cell wall biosynthesis